ncbi:MAG: hypothetical protein QGG64_18175, partial [Candidatus Latescibacteria bacterium]|nr:hypothetical protein [Candidatus Latescibacterota bacterium]
MRYFITCLTLIFLAAQSDAQQPAEVSASDTPNDSGGSITVTWRHGNLPEGAVYKVAVAELESGPFHHVSDVKPSDNFQSEDPAIFGHGEETSQY